MKVANAATVTGREPLPYSTPAPVDLPTEARTQDVEAWRQEIAERREQQASLREMASTSRDAEYARPAAPPEPVRDREPVREPIVRPAEANARAERPVEPAPAPAPSPRPEVGGARRPRRAMSSADVATAVQSYLDGSTIPEISGALGRGTRTIRQALLGAGVQLRDDRAGHSGGRPKTAADDDPALVAKVRRLYLDEGRNQDAVARELGASRKAVQGIMARHEIPARPSARDLPSLRADGALGLRARMDAAGVSSADVRAWARATGREVPLRGVPSAALVDAYLAALEAPTAPDADLAECMPALIDAPRDDTVEASGLPGPVDPAAIDPESISAAFAEYSAATAGMIPGAPTAATEETTELDPPAGPTDAVDAAAAEVARFALEFAEYSKPAAAPVVELVDATLSPVLDEVLASLQDVVTTTAQLLQAQQAVAAYRVRRLQALAAELLAVLTPPTPTTGG